MATSPPSLTPLQRQILQEFFSRERGFFLTGGGALAGFYLHHRDTEDLDLFTADEAAFERGLHALTGAVAAIGAAMVARQYIDLLVRRLRRAALPESAR